jgi:hypothetical protein
MVCELRYLFRETLRRPFRERGHKVRQRRHARPRFVRRRAQQLEHPEERVDFRVARLQKIKQKHT